MIDDFGIEQVEESTDSDRRFNGVMAGQVINPLDPMVLGRVQVRAPALDALDLMPWARIAVPMAGLLHGTYFVPHIGDSVLLAFEHGDPNAPYVIGSIHDALHPPPLPSPLPEIRTIRTISGNQIVFSEFTETIAIQTGPTAPAVIPSPPSPGGPHQTIMMSPVGITMMTPFPVIINSPTAITLQVGGSTIAVTPAGVVITAPAVSIVGASTASISSASVRINS